MAIFEYRALDASGEVVKGLIDADDLQEARSQLRQRGIYPTEVRGESVTVSVSKEISLSGIWRRISKREIALFTRQLATLLEAGLPLVEALSSLVDQLGDRALMGGESKGGKFLFRGPLRISRGFLFSLCQYDQSGRGERHPGNHSQAVSRPSGEGSNLSE